jgi:hypothetical protein
LRGRRRSRENAIMIFTRMNQYTYTFRAEPFLYEKLQHAKRFDPLPNGLECQLTAAFHPRFRLMWLQKQDPDRVSVVKEAMELQVEACMKEEDEVAAASSSDSSVEENPEDDWFSTFTQAPVERGSRNIHKTNVVKLVGTWITGPFKVDLGDGAFMGEKVLSKLFVKLTVVINECILRTLK